MLRNKYFYSLILVQFMLLLFTAGCSEDDTYYKLDGYWEGENKNIATGIDWPFSMYIEHRGTEISGIYSDYRGNLTLRNITYSGQDIGFLIDLWPESVTFFGSLDNENSMNGTWSFSGDNNMGEWYLLKDQDPGEEEEEEEEEGTSSNPFAGQ